MLETLLAAVSNTTNNNAYRGGVIMAVLVLTVFNEVRQHFDSISTFAKIQQPHGSEKAQQQVPSSLTTMMTQQQPMLLSQQPKQTIVGQVVKNDNYARTGDDGSRPVPTRTTSTIGAAGAAAQSSGQDGSQVGAVVVRQPQPRKAPPSQQAGKQQQQQLPPLQQKQRPPPAKATTLGQQQQLKQSQLKQQQSQQLSQQQRQPKPSTGQASRLRPNVRSIGDEDDGETQEDRLVQLYRHSIETTEQEIVSLELDCKVKRRRVKREKEQGRVLPSSLEDKEKCEAEIAHAKNRLQRRKDRLYGDERLKELLAAEEARSKSSRKSHPHPAKADTKSKLRNEPDYADFGILSDDDDSIVPAFLLKPSEEWGEKEEEEFRFFHKRGYPTWWEVKAKMSCPHELRKPRQRPTEITVFTPTYMDRSGSVIKRMIETYAYAVKHGYKFGGGINRVLDPDWPRKKKVHEEFIEAVGLSEVLKFATPHKKNVLEYNVDWLHCVRGIELTEDFLAMLRSKQIPMELPPPIYNTDGTVKKKVAVHMRRGDAQPCTDKIFAERYHPNAYYLMAIKKYVGEKAGTDADVTIFSESASFESFDEFIDRGYGLELDGAATDAWTAIMTADVVILSPGSHFGEVPALLNPNGHVYSNEDDGNYVQVDEQILLRSGEILDNLVSDRCEEFLLAHPEHKATHTLWR